MFLIKAKNTKKGYIHITDENDPVENTMMDFGILKLEKGKKYEDSVEKERAFLLMNGHISFSFEGKEEESKRDSLFDEGPTCLHVSKDVKVTISSLTDCELAVISTTNKNAFSSEYYTSQDVENEHRGKGTMQETSTRIVRTIFDKSNSPLANLVLGEVVNYPGKWSSYPPHHHSQPEIYHYRFLPKEGFGLALLGEEAYKIENGDTLKILEDRVHPQVSAPGYAMYYIWAIRHLEGNPYIKPIFVPEHMWVMEKDAPIWPNRNGSE